MRKGILFSLLCLIAVVATACGGGNNTGNSGKDGGSDGGDAACDGGDGDGDGCGGDACGADDGSDDGSDGSDDGSEASDVWALYKVKGRSWLLKNTTEIEGMDPMISYSKTEIVDVADDHAMIKTWTLDKDKNPMAGMPEPEPTKIEFVTASGDGTDGTAVEQTEESITVEAGDFDCIVTESGGSKVWTSKEYPGLMVKMTHASGGSELVEFNAG